MLDGASSLLPEVGKYPGPMEDASLGPRQSPLRLTELTFGLSHTPAPGLAELWVCGHILDATRIWG
jgi:hypothetical protein